MARRRVEELTGVTTGDAGGPGSEPGPSTSGDAVGDDAAIQRLLEGIRDIADYPQPGVLFKDITPLLADPELLRLAVDRLATPWSGEPRVDKVVGIEARGFILAAPVALALGAGFVPVRKRGKLPAATRSAAYTLEYGEEIVEIHADAVAPGERVLIVDDVLATGGTVRAVADLITDGGATVAGVQLLLEIGALAGRDRIPEHRVESLLHA